MLAIRLNAGFRLLCELPGIAGYQRVLTRAFIGAIQPSFVLIEFRWRIGRGTELADVQRVGRAISAQLADHFTAQRLAMQFRARRIEPQAKRGIDIELPTHRRQRKASSEQQAITGIRRIRQRFYWRLQIECA